MPNGQTVRIGFGKADSAPVAPAKGANMNGPISPQPGGVANKNSNNNAGLGGIESQVQSTPTRALWIGSIPSTTTPATILNVFSPFGPIESARVLTHKNCGFSELDAFGRMLSTRPDKLLCSKFRTFRRCREGEESAQWPRCTWE